MAVAEPKRRYSKKEITIKIVSESKPSASGGGGSSKASSDEDISNKILSFLSHPLQSIKRDAFDNKITGKHLIAQYIFDNAVSNTKRIAMFSYNKYLNLSENYLLENDAEAVKKGLDFFGGLGASMIAGAKLGSAGGGPGMVVGAVVGGLTYGFGSGISYEQKKYGYYNSIASSTYQNQYSQIRAGLIDGGRNTNE